MKADAEPLTDIRPEATIDRTVFATALLITLSVSIPLLIWPGAAAQHITGIYNWIAETLGLFYQWAVIAMVLFLGWIALGKHGALALGPPGARADFGNFAWMAMLFCGGVGAGLVYWATIEWAHYLDHPPFGVAPGGDEARAWATCYGLFHWGPLAWTIYALPTVAISVQYYLRGAPTLRLSTAIYGMFGNHQLQAAMTRLLDGVFMLSLLAGAGTSIGLVVPMISACIADAAGIPHGLGLDIGVVLCCMVLLAAAAYSGLARGIAALATFNIKLALAFLGFMLLAGPTLFILRLGTESIGFMLQNSLRMITYTDPVHRTGFVESWTIFYWAWWIAFGPFVGIFVTRISRGRTLRGLILGMSVFGSLGAAVFFTVLGGTAFYLDLHGLVPVRQIVSQQGDGPAISAVIGALPFGRVMRAVFAAISVIFIATSYNSKAYALAASSTLRLSVGDDPARWNRVFWAITLGLLPIALMSVNGGIKVAMSAVLVASVPLLLIAALMCLNLLRTLRLCHDGP